MRTIIPPREWFQIRLRTLFVVTTLSGMVLGWVLIPISQALRQRQFLRALEKRGARISYDHDPRSVAPPTGPAWARRLFGDDLFVNAVALSFVMEPGRDTDLARLAELPLLTGLNLDGSAVNDEGLAFLANLRRLKHLSLRKTRLTNLGLAHLRALINLEALNLDSTAVSDAGMIELAELPRLIELSLNETQATGKGLGNLSPRLVILRIADNDLGDEDVLELQSLSAIIELDLRGADITDRGLESFPPLPNLTRLYLSRTKVTPNGIAMLRRRLPALTTISW
jgi:hypothetical protein